MLSISTIASAIANASISTDPSQLAAMIVDLSKKSRTRNYPESAGCSTKEVSAATHVSLSRVASSCVFVEGLLCSFMGQESKKKNHSEQIAQIIQSKNIMHAFFNYC